MIVLKLGDKCLKIFKGKCGKYDYPNKRLANEGLKHFGMGGRVYFCKKCRKHHITTKYKTGLKSKIGYGRIP